MNGMFSESKFNGALSKWNVSNVTDMNGMFRLSLFNSDISKWNVSKVKNKYYMFGSSNFNKNMFNLKEKIKNNKTYSNLHDLRLISIIPILIFILFFLARIIQFDQIFNKILQFILIRKI